MTSGEISRESAYDAVSEVLSEDGPRSRRLAWKVADAAINAYHQTLVDMGLLQDPATVGPQAGSNDSEEMG